MEVDAHTDVSFYSHVQAVKKQLSQATAEAESEGARRDEQHAAAYASQASIQRLMEIAGQLHVSMTAFCL